MSTVPKSATLRWIANDQEQKYVCQLDEVTLGRRAECDIVLAHASVSREHAVILKIDGGFAVKDLASSYGTRIGEQRLQPFDPYLLKEGDEIQIGKQVVHFSLLDAPLPNPQEEDQVAFQHYELRHELNRFETALNSHIAACAPKSAIQELPQRVAEEVERLNRYLSARFKEYEVLQEVTQTIAGILDLRELLSTVLKLASRVLNADRGFILLYDPVNNDLRSEVTRHFDRAEHGALEHDLNFSQTVARTCFNTKELVIIEDAMQDVRFASAHSIVASSIRSVVCLPLIKGDQVSGVLYLDNLTTPGCFNEHHLNFLRTFAAQTALALDNARLYTQAVTDGLTRLYNRKFADERIAEEMVRSLRYDRPCSLILLDVDFFKKVNDTYGHHAGDVVLKHISSCLQEKARSSDLTARYGGEEFLMLLPETEAEGAVAFAERVRSGIEALEVKVEDKTIKITISCGVTTYRKAHQSSVQVLVNEADQALYQAKHSGRNRVCQFSAQ